MKLNGKKIKSKPSELTQKYGIEKVEALIIHLQQILKTNQHLNNIQQTKKIKNQLQYLKQQKNRYVVKNNNQIVNHLIACIQQQKNKILSQFQQQQSQYLQYLIKQINNIQQQLNSIHKQQYIKLQQSINQKLLSLYNKKSYHIINYLKEISQLCQHQLYYQAERVKQLLNQQSIQQSKNKYYQWKNYRNKQIQMLFNRQSKQKNALKTRLKSFLQNQLKCKNDDYVKLIKKIQIKKNKIQHNLTSKNSIIHKQILSLVSSRCTSKRNKKDPWQEKQSKIYCQPHSQTDPSLIAQTLIWITPPKQKSGTNYIHQ